jgi:hypothetical protein
MPKDRVGKQANRQKVQDQARICWNAAFASAAKSGRGRLALAQPHDHVIVGLIHSYHEP